MVLTDLSIFYARIKQNARSAHGRFASERVFNHFYLSRRVKRVSALVSEIILAKKHSLGAEFVAVEAVSVRGL
jgi:hypothetical protein